MLRTSIKPHGRKYLVTYAVIQSDKPVTEHPVGIYDSIEQAEETVDTLSAFFNDSLREQVENHRAA